MFKKIVLNIKLRKDIIYFIVIIFLLLYSTIVTVERKEYYDRMRALQINYGQSISKSTTSPTPIAEVEQIITTSDQTNWKIYVYRNSELDFNFSLKYPPIWFESRENPSHTSSGRDVIFSSEKVDNVNTRNVPCVSVGATIARTTTDLMEEQDGAKVADPTSSYDKYGVPSKMVSYITKVISTKNIIVNGMEGVKRTVIITGESASEQVFLRGSINSTYGSNQYTFYTIESCPNTTEFIFKEILGSFKNN